MIHQSQICLAIGHLIMQHLTLTKKKFASESIGAKMPDLSANYDYIINDLRIKK